MPNRSPKMFLKTSKAYLKYLYIVPGVFMALLGVFCIFFSNLAVNRLIDNQMQLRPGSDVVKMWSRPDVNISLDLYFFNWTNSEDFYNMKTKPKLEEVGPYSYTEVPIKKIFQWHPENNTMDYGKADLYYFNEKKTNGSLDDNLISINALLVGAASKSRHWSFMGQTVIDMALKFYKNGVVWKRTADEFFFKGFKDNIINLLAVLPVSFRSSLGLLIPWDRIGYTHARNGSTDFLGKYTIHTGVGDVNQIGQMVRWKDKNYTDAYSKECQSIRGSAGEFQKPNIKKNVSLAYFFADLCRPIYMDYLDEVSIEGVTGYRYVISPRAYDNGTTYPESECYCGDQCVPFGAMNIGNCWFGLPIFVSEPHFLNADQFHLDKVVGMKPNRSKHLTTVTLEPRTGFLLELRGRLQVNIFIEPTYHISAFPSRRRMLFPVTWFDMHARISKDTANVIRLLNNMSFYCHITGIVTILISSILLLWQPCKRKWNSRYAQHMEITTMADDEYDNDDLGEAKEVENKENIFGMPSNFPSLLYITAHPRRSLPIIINHMEGDDEALSSCLEDERQQQFELAPDDCDIRLGDS